MSTPINPEDQPQQQLPQPQQPLPSQPQYAPPPQPQYAPPPQQPNYQVPPQYQAPQYAAPQYAAQQPHATAANYAQYAVPGVPGPGEPFDGAISPDDLTRPLYGATFGQAIRRFFKNYVNFSGRASRSEFWWVELFLFLVSLVPLVLYMIGAITLAASSYDSSYGYSSSASLGTGAGALFLGLGLVLLIVIGLGTLLPSIAIVWRRLHDINFAGPFYFLGFIPYVGGLIVLIFTILSPKPEGRRFDRR